MLYGLGILVIIALMGGAIAFIGDKLGTKVGKRRMSLFGLRPRYTSMIVTIITGMLISAVTLGILSIMSQNVRTALFGMEKLQAQMKQLNDDVDAKNKELADSQNALSAKTAELETVNGEVKATKEDLAESQAARDAIGAQLEDVQAAYDESEQKLAQSNSDISALEATRAKMEDHITNLQVAARKLEEGLTYVREGNVIFRVGEVLSGAVVKPGLSLTESEHVVSGIVKDTNNLVLKKLNIQGDQSVLYVNRANIEEVTQQIAQAKEPLTIRVTASANIISGEPALAEIHVYPYKLIYSKGDTVWSSVIKAGSGAQNGVLTFLDEVNKVARKQGVLPDPISGNVGNLPGEQLYRAIDTLSKAHGTYSIKALAKTDTYSDGPVQIELVIDEIE